MYFETPPPTTVPRRVACPVDVSAPVVQCLAQFGGPTIAALATFVHTARDTLDYGIDFTQWLKSNGDTELTDVQWDAVVDPAIQNPTIASSQFFPGGEAWFILGPGTAGDN